MRLFNFSGCIFLLLIFTILLSFSCGKSGSSPTPNPCSGITVTVSGSTTNPSTPGALNGSISVSASGGSGFTYSINGGSFQSSGLFSGLIAGSYSIVAKNINGCSGTASFTLTDPTPCAGIIITVGGTVINPANSGATNGSITVIASGSTGFTYNINGGAFQSPNVFSNLGVGVFVVIVKDANGCTGSTNFTLTAPNPCVGITITVGGAVTNPSVSGANDGSIVATATGSTGFTYNLNGGAFQASGTFNNLSAGSYIISAKDLNGCTGNSTFTLTNPNPCSGVTVTAGASVNPNTPCASPSGTITVTPAGGISPYTFNLNSGAFQSSPVFLNLANGTYSVAAKDVNGCIGTTSNVIVPNLPAGPLFGAVRILLDNNCVSCHNNTTAEGGMNWTIDCNVVMFKDRIKARAVDAIPSVMPPTGALPASEKQKIINWIAAGGKFTD